MPLKTAWIALRVVYRGKCSKRHGGCGRTLSAGTPAKGRNRAVDLIALAAEDWAAATDWEPGPSDA
jgi:hypothetical protein